MKSTSYILFSAVAPAAVPLRGFPYNLGTSLAFLRGLRRLKRSLNAGAWHGPEPLPNPLDVVRLGEIYSRTAAFYDGIVAEKQAGPKLEAVRQLDRRPGERFLEVGVGTAWAFARVIEASGAQGAYGVDVAPGMLEVSRATLAAKGFPPPLLLADGRQLPFPDETFDCLLNTYTFEVLATPDIGPLLDECQRVLRPGGRIAVVNLTDGEGDDAAMTDEWKRRYEDDPEFFGGARPLHLQPMLEAHGFERVARTYVGPDWPSEVLLAYRA
jgi:SAM-dependent methyltransferase